MSEQLYKKVGRKYIPIGYSDGFTGFPSEGIWVVFDTPGRKSMSCIGKVGEFKPLDYSLLASLIRERETQCLQTMLELHQRGNYSNYEVVMSIFETLLSNE